MNRTIAPPFKLAESLSLVIPQEIKLENDITLFWMKDVKDDSVKLDIEWFAGTKYQEQKLAASFTNKLLLSGNATKNAKSIAAEMDFYGGFIQDEIDKDHAAVTLYGLRENFHAIFKVFEEAMLTCEFPEREFEEERTIALSKYKIDSGKVKYLCQRKFNTCLFGVFIIRTVRVAEEPDFLAVKREDLIKFHKEFYLRTKPVLFLVGNVDDRVIDD
jgi:zinc protease